MGKRSKAGIMVGMIILMILLLIGFSGVTFGEEKTILTVWDQWGMTGFSAAGPAAEELEKMFEKQNPHIELVRSFFGTMDIRTTLKVALAAGDQPDCWHTWPASAFLNARARAGFLADLTEPAIERGWLKDWTDPMAKRCMLNGRVYGVPFDMDYGGVYYNRDIFDKLGLTEPETYGEFLDVCEKVKQAGYIPLAFGNAGVAYHCRHMLSMFLNLVIDREEFSEIMFGNGRWDGPKVIEALRLYRNVAAKGYFNEGFNGIGLLEGSSLFLNEQAAMEMTGTWFISWFIKDAEFNLDMFLLPPLKAGDPPALLIGEGSQYEVSSRISQAKKEAAIEYLDFLQSDEALPIWVEKGGVVPCGKHVDWTKVDVHPVVKKFYSEGEKWMKKGAGIWDCVTNFDAETTLFLRSNLGSVIDGTISIDEFVKDFQKRWEQAKAEGVIWTPGEVPGY